MYVCIYYEYLIITYFTNNIVSKTNSVFLDTMMKLFTIVKMKPEVIYSNHGSRLFGRAP